MKHLHINAALLSIVSIVAAVSIMKTTDFHTSSVTRVNNLEITGTTQATGLVTANTGVRLAAAGTGPLITTGAGSPDTVVTATQGSLFVRTDTAQVWQNTNGAQAWTQLGASSSGGFAGTWAAGTYAAGSIVRRGPFLFGTTTSTSLDPCIDEGDLGNAATWVARGNATQSGDLLILTTNTSQSSAGFRLATVAGWNGKRLIADALVGPFGGADTFQMGIYDSSLTTNPSLAPGQGLIGVTGFYGIAVDIWTDRVGTILDGVFGNFVATPTTGNPGVQGNSILETTYYYRYYLDFVDNGATMTLTLWRENYTNISVSDAGFIATWTVAKPAWTSWRYAFGGGTGGTVGFFRVHNAYTRDLIGPWTLLSVFPHTPRIDAEMLR